MSQYNPCYGCTKRTAGCHAECTDYAELKVDNAKRKAYRAANRKTTADELLGAGYHRRARKYRR